MDTGPGRVKSGALIVIHVGATILAWLAGWQAGRPAAWQLPSRQDGYLAAWQPGQPGLPGLPGLPGTLALRPPACLVAATKSCAR